MTTETIVGKALAPTEAPSVVGVAERDLGVQPVSGTSWRVCDTRLPEDDVFRLLGFIENKGDRFEVMQLDHGFVWLSFDSLREAVAQFTRVRSGERAREDHVLSWMSGRDADL